MRVASNANAYITLGRYTFWSALDGRVYIQNDITRHVVETTEEELIVALDSVFKRQIQKGPL